MIFFFAFLFLGFVVSLFCLYHVAREDFVLLRRNVSLEDMFNVAFVTFFAGIFFARLFYVVFNFAPGFLNPLVFFLIPYFPGLNLAGGVAGGVLVLIYFCMKKKWPVKRIFDLIALSFLAGLPVGYVGSLFISTEISYFIHIFLPLIFFVAFMVAYLLAYPRLIRREIKPGMLGTSVIIVFSFVLLSINIISSLDAGKQFLQIEDVIPLALFICSLVYFVKQDLFVIKVKK